jgi:hypothetical protein
VPAHVHCAVGRRLAVFSSPPPFPVVLPATGPRAANVNRSSAFAPDTGVVAGSARAGPAGPVPIAPQAPAVVSGSSSSSSSSSAAAAVNAAPASAHRGAGQRDDKQSGSGSRHSSFVALSRLLYDHLTCLSSFSSPLPPFPSAPLCPPVPSPARLSMSATACAQQQQSLPRRVRVKAAAWVC